MKRNKIVLLISSAVALTLVATIGISLAFASAVTNQKSNSFVKGVPGVDTIENSSTTTSTNEVNYTKKEVNAKNTGSISEYVRIMLVPSYKSAADVGFTFGEMPTAIASSATSFTMGDLRLNLASGWSGKWFYVYDSTEKVGYFYYKDILSPNSTTKQTLLSSIGTTDGTTGEKLNSMLANLQIDVITDSVQSEGGAVTNVWGKYVVENSDHTISEKP